MIKALPFISKISLYLKSSYNHKYVIYIFYILIPKDYQTIKRLPKIDQYKF